MRMKELMYDELESTYKHWRNLYQVANKEGIRRAWGVEKNMTYHRMAINFPINGGNIFATGLVGIIITSLGVLGNR
jgi:hypothetical protein